MGLPFALTLFRPELAVWSPGEHNGTFRGNNHALVTATAALRHFWSDRAFVEDIRRRGAYLGARLERIANENGLSRRGRGRMRGLNLESGGSAPTVLSPLFRSGED